MSVTSITIENFKGIGETAVTVPIRPITLLFGKNGSGKSTILDALGYFSDVMKGSQFDMSRDEFRSLVHRHELDRKIRIRVESIFYDIYTDSRSIRVWSEIVMGWHDYGDWVPGLHYCESFLVGAVLESGEEVCFCFHYEGFDENFDVIGANGQRLVLWKELENGDSDKFQYIYTSESELSRDAKEYVDGMVKLLDIKESAIKESVDHISDSIGQEVSNQALNICRMGVLRDNQDIWDVLGWDDELLKRTNHYLKDVFESRYSIRRSERKSEKFLLYDEKNDIEVDLQGVGWLCHLVPVIVCALDGRFNVFAVEYPESNLHPAMQLLLGDLFIDCAKSRNKVITEFWEGIEAKLGTKVTGVMDDVERFRELKGQELGKGTDADREFIDILEFLEFARTFEWDSEIVKNPKLLEFTDAIERSNRTMLIETHSEHLLLRLLRRVRETTCERKKDSEYSYTLNSRYLLSQNFFLDYPLTPDDLSLIYVRYVRSASDGSEEHLEEKGKGTEIEFVPIEITDDGDFGVPCPEGFFDERIEELF